MSRRVKTDRYVICWFCGLIAVSVAQEVTCDDDKWEADGHE
jgi:hypothetical protein